MTSPRLHALPLLAAAALASALGCTSTADVSPEKAKQWDGTSAGLSDPEITFSVFERAVREGDLDALVIVFAAGALDNLVEDVAARGRDEVSTWYKRDAQRFAFTDHEWVKRSDRLAYLRVRIATRAAASAEMFAQPEEAPEGAGGGARTAVFAFGYVRGAWRITGFRGEYDSEER